MPDLALPLALASGFTAGAYMIARAGRHADFVAGLLTWVALAPFMTGVVIALARWHERSRPGPTSQAARPVTGIGHGRAPAHVPAN